MSSIARSTCLASVHKIIPFHSGYIILLACWHRQYDLLVHWYSYATLTSSWPSYSIVNRGWLRSRFRKQKAPAAIVLGEALLCGTIRIVLTGGMVALVAHRIQILCLPIPTPRPVPENSTAVDIIPSTRVILVGSHLAGRLRKQLHSRLHRRSHRDQRRPRLRSGTSPPSRLRLPALREGPRSRICQSRTLFWCLESRP